MLRTLESILLSVATSEAMLGVLGNAFIVLVNCTDWVRNKKLSKIGFILTGLAISRIFTIWIITLDAYTKVFFLSILMSSNLLDCMNYIWVIINHLSICFATSLSIFYFLKIANFSHYIFLWLKRKADKVFVFLVGYLIITWLASFPLAVKVIKDIKMHQSNTSWLVHLEKRELLINYDFFQYGAHFPLYGGPNCLFPVNHFPLETQQADAIHWIKIQRSQHRSSRESHKSFNFI